MSVLQVTRAIEFCAGHRLLQYEGNCKNVHGHNFRAEIRIEGSALNKSGMIVDFNEIRDKVKTWIDENWDHGFLVNQHDERMINFLISGGQKHFVVNRLLDGFGSDPIAACNPTVENLSLILKEHVRKMFPKHYPGISVRLYESDNGWVTA